MCDMVPRHRAAPGQLGILLLAWHCARGDKIYVWAGRIGLGREPSREHRYRLTSPQRKAAEGPLAVPSPAQAMGEASPDFAALNI